MYIAIGFHFSGKVKVTQSLQPVDCSPPGSSLHGILQARILEWAAISFSSFSDKNIIFH